MRRAGFADRAANLAAAVTKGIEWLALRHEAVVERLISLPMTFIHGEFFACNVWIQGSGKDRRVCPVDWEMASVGPGLLDLAALCAGWSDRKRTALALSYYDVWRRQRNHRLPSKADFLSALDCCQLQLAIKMLGWSSSWSAPPQHSHNWLTEAIALPGLGSADVAHNAWSGSRSGLSSWVLQWLVGRATRADVCSLKVRVVRDAQPVTQRMGDDWGFGIASLDALLAQFELAGHWSFVDADAHYHGIARERLAALFKSADLFIDLGLAHGEWTEEAASAALRVFVDSDPGFTQMMWDQYLAEDVVLPNYDFHYSVGQNIGTEHSPAAGGRSGGPC